VWLDRQHPDLPSCSDCQRFLFDEKWKPVTRGGEHCERPKGSVTPCWKCPKIPKGEKPEPANAVEMTEKSRQAFRHYLRCRAVNRFPVDELVEHNAALIRAVEDQIQKSEADGRHVEVLKMLALVMR